MKDHERRLLRLARGQHGLVTRAQALEVGLSPSAWTHLIQGGRLIRVHRGVARTVTSPETTHQRALAAVLALGGGVVSHTTAAELWGAPVRASTAHVTLPRRVRYRSLAGTRVHTCNRASFPAHVRRDGVPLTTARRTLVDLAAVEDDEHVARALSHFLVKRWVTLASIEAEVARRAGRGYRGAAVLRRVLGTWDRSPQAPESELEVAVRQLLTRAGLPLPALQHQVGRYRLDMAYPAHKVGIEADGWAVHGQPESFTPDRERDHELVADGWTIVHVTAETVRDRPAQFVARMAATLAAHPPGDR